MSQTIGILQDLVVGIDHVGICVADIGKTGTLWQSLFGIPLTGQEDVAAQNTSVAFLRTGGSAAVEFVSPMESNPGLEKFLDKRGQGMHHLAIGVSDLTEALRRLKAAEIRLIDEKPRLGAAGHLVAFLHPKAMEGTLVELIQRTKDQLGT